MKHIKRFNESFDLLEDVANNVRKMFSGLKNFDFNIEIQTNEEFLTIKIEKNNKQEKVFYSLDIKDNLSKIDEYLTLGEGLKIDKIYTKTIEEQSEDLTINQLLRRNIALLELNLIYTL